jgi:hypothetical protein
VAEGFGVSYVRGIEELAAALPHAAERTGNQQVGR